ncbi:MAG TPA: thioredoxin family protein [Alkalispirochaeta sp.]|nr:thioredoxin family protein [Alkalispirochaeta sp.]
MEQLPLDESTWTGGLKPPDYFQSLANYKHLVLSLYRDASVAPDDRDQVAAVLPAPADELRLVVLTEDWCGDSASTLPYIARLAEELQIPTRVFRQSRNSRLKQWYTDRGTEHIPVVSLVAPTEQTDVWDEWIRWVERPEAAHGKVKTWLEANPRLPELYARKDEDDEAAKEYTNLYARLLRDMASWYRDGLWSEIPSEFSHALREQ